MKILIVEDDTRIANPLVRYLQQEHHRVDLAVDGIAGWNYARTLFYDIILLDLMLPKLDGITLCQNLRSEGNTAMILMLTAKDTTTDKVIGLDAGADDYLIKPFRLNELSARIRALSRRSRDFKPPVLTQGELVVRPAEAEVTFKQRPLLLTPKEFMLLEYFMRHPGLVLSRATLLEQLWNFDEDSSEASVKTHMTNLRRKLKTAGVPPTLIETVYGLGYRLRSLSDSSEK